MAKKQMRIGTRSSSLALWQAEWVKAELEKRGVVAKNLAQTLAYLKRQGKVASPSRSIYTPA